MHQDLPILEFDPTPDAIIEPSRVVRGIDIPEHCVVCFFQEVITKLVQERQAKLLTHQRSEIGQHPVYEIDVDGKRLAFLHPGVGAPLAASLLEESIALGCRKFIACGSCGVLDPQIAVGHVIVPHTAIRDEGTSYHYLPPSREVQASPAGVAAIEQVLTQHDCQYIVAKTWTTDAIYRETANRIQKRRSEGCLAVEMEAAAFFAVAQFRGVTFAQILYGGDDISGNEWDSRNWDKQTSVRERLFWYAAEACLSL